MILTDIKRRVAKHYLEECLDKKDPTIYKDLAIAARAIANRMIMDWFDMRGIHHCKECPSDQQLVNLAGDYYCSNHAHSHVKKPLELVCP